MDLTRNTRRRTTKIEENDCILKDLVHLLKNKLEKYYIKYYISEIELLKKFPPHDVILPVVNFSPRVIIEHMRNRHEHTKYMIEEELIPLKYYLYRYKHNEGIKCYKFTNNMSLPHDIFTICYLHHLQLATEFKGNELELIENVSKIMIDKYKIQMIKKNNKMIKKEEIEKILSNPKSIIETRITYSFPSISFPMYHFLISKHNYKCQTLFNFSETVDLRRAFFGFYKKRYLWLSNVFSSIIPRLDTCLPLAYLIAQAIKSEKMYYFANPNVGERSLTEIYECVQRLYYSEAFPMSLKLTLCDTWNIVHIIDNNCEYASFFRDCRNYDINTIRMFGLNDPNLQSILSIL